MPEPGFNAGTNRRLVSHSGEKWKLGSCQLGTLETSDAIFDDGRATLTASGFTGILSPDLADDDGRMPTVLAEPNVTLTIAPYVDAQGTRSPGIWRGTFGGVNTGTALGFRPSHEARMQRQYRREFTGSPHLPTLFRVDLYILCRLASGACLYLKYFSGGGEDYPEMLAGRAVTLSQKLGIHALLPRPIFRPGADSVVISGAA